MARKTELTPGQLMIIGRLVDAGAGTQAILDDLIERGLRTRKRREPTWDQVDRARKSLISERQPPIGEHDNTDNAEDSTDDPDPGASGEGEARPPAPTGAITIDRTSALVERTQVERGWVVDTSKKLLELELEAVLERQENGGLQLTRCDKCHGSDVRRISAIHRALRGHNTYLISVERAEEKTPQGPIIYLSPPPMDSSGEGAPPGSGAVSEEGGPPVMSVDLVRGIRSYLEEHGLVWDDMMKWVKAYLAGTP